MTTLDRDRRHKIAVLIRHLAAGLITNDEFEDSVETLLEGIKDQEEHAFLWGTYSVAWCFYSDNRCYRLRGKDRLNKEERRSLARMILFLESGRTYKGPKVDAFGSSTGCLLNLVTLGLFSLIAQPFDTELRDINWDIWPYINPANFTADLRRPRLLAG